MTEFDNDESPSDHPIEVEQLDLDPESAVEIEDAIREALEAIEESASEGDDAGAGSDDLSASAEADVDSQDLAAEVAELRERSMRTLADFENYRKRVQRERADESTYANLHIIREFLIVVDNLERAQVAKGSAEDLQKGVELILQQVHDLISRFGVTRIDSSGQAFDPNLHEAVSRDEEADVAVPTVVEEFQPGYQMYERLLRPAMVRVAMPAEATDEPAEPLSTAGDEDEEVPS